MIKKICLPIMLLISVSIAAQTNPDKHMVAMELMMSKLIMAAPGNFANIKGAKATVQGNAVFYKANLVATVTDAAEMKTALATDLFGAMQTVDDHIVVTPDATFYLARYTDDDEFSITNMVTEAFAALSANFNKPGTDAKVEKIAGETADETGYVLAINNIPVGKLTCNTKAGTAALIIGLKK